MTLVIAVCMGDIGIIAADKAVTMHHADGTTTTLDMEADKIVETPMGVVTGSGFVEILDPVKEFLATLGIASTDDALDEITRVRNNFRLMYPFSSEREKHLGATSWVFNYTVGGSDPKLRIAAFHPSWSETKLKVLQAGAALCIAPADYTLEQGDELNAALNDQLCHLNAQMSAREALVRNIRLIVETVRKVSELSNSVSNTCDLAIVAPNTRIMGRNVTTENVEEKFSNLLS